MKHLLKSFPLGMSFVREVSKDFVLDTSSEEAESESDK